MREPGQWTSKLEESRSVTDGYHSLLDKHFLIEGQLCAAACTDLFEGVWRSSPVPVWIWRHRHPLPNDGRAADLFRQRIGNTVLLVPMDSYGVDDEGRGFVVLEPPAYGLLRPQDMPFEVAERVFLECIALIALLNDKGMVCGDLSCNSFGLGSSGEVRLCSLMGLPTLVGAPFDIATVPEDMLLFLSPEAKRGEVPTHRSDVFSLGVIGMRLLNRPQRELEHVRSVLGDPLLWTQQILPRCMAPVPADRFREAESILDAIKPARDRESERTRPKTSQPTFEFKPNSEILIDTGSNATENVEPEPESLADQIPKSRRNYRIRKGLILAGILGGSIVVVGMSALLKPKPQVKVAEQKKVAEPENVGLLKGEELKSRLEAWFILNDKRFPEAVAVARSQHLYADAYLDELIAVGFDPPIYPARPAVQKLLNGDLDDSILKSLSSWNNGIKAKWYLHHLATNPNSKLSGTILEQLELIEALPKETKAAIRDVPALPGDKVALQEILAAALVFDNLTQEQKDALVNKIGEQQNPKQLVAILTVMNDSSLGTVLMQRFGASLNFGLLVNLFKTAAPTTKKSIINLLKIYNQYPEFRTIEEVFAQERDPEVKESFKNVFPQLGKNS